MPVSSDEREKGRRNFVTDNCGISKKKGADYSKPGENALEEFQETRVFLRDIYFRAAESDEYLLGRSEGTNIAAIVGFAF